MNANHATMHIYQNGSMRLGFAMTCRLESPYERCWWWWWWLSLNLSIVLFFIFHIFLTRREVQQYTALARKNVLE